MFKLALKNIRPQLRRYILAIFAIMLGISFMVASFCLKDMMTNELNKAFQSSVNYDLRVRTPQNSSSNNSQTAIVGQLTKESSLPLSFQNTIQSLSSVKEVKPRIQGSIKLIQKSDTVFGNISTSIIGKAYDKTSPDTASFITNLKGGFPKIDKEILISTELSSSMNLKIGDRLKFIYSSKVIIGKLIGTYTPQSSSLTGFTVYFSQSYAKKLFAKNNNVSAFYIWKSQKIPNYELKKQVENALNLQYSSIDFEVQTSEEIVEEENKSASDILGFAQIFVLIFALIALFVSSFIIANTLNMLVVSKMKEYALLRAIGASSVQVYITVLFQALILGLIGAIFGILLAFGLLSLLSLVLGGLKILTVSIPFPSFISCVIAISTSFIVCLFASFSPSRKAANTAPVEAMGLQTRTEKSIGIRSFLGFLSIALGVAFCIIGGIKGSLDKGDKLYEGLDMQVSLGLGACLFVTGALIFLPLLVQILIPVISLILRPINKHLLLLAKQNLLTNKRRTASTASSLFICITLVTTLSVVTQSTKSTTEKIVNSNIEASFFLMSGGTNGINKNLANDIETIPNVKRVSNVNISSLKVDGKTEVVRSVDKDFFKDIYVYNENETRSYEYALNNNFVIVGKDWAKEHHVYLDSTLTFTSQYTTGKLPDQEKIKKMDPSEIKKYLKDTNFKVITKTKELVVKLISDDPNMLGIYFSNKLMSELTSSETRFNPMAYISTYSKDNLDSTKTQIEQKMAKYYTYTLMTKEDLSNMFSSILDAVLSVLYAMLVLSLIIAMLGIINTMSLSIIQRTQEIGLLRAIGLSKTQLNIMLLFESLLISIFSTVLGILSGIFLSFELQLTESKLGLSDFQINYQSIVVILILSIIIGFFASIIPARRAKKLEILDAISTE